MDLAERQIALTVTERISLGAAAIAGFENESPDLVLLDINMPRASGFQVCEAIRKRSRVPVMMLTVRGEEEDLVKAIEQNRRTLILCSANLDLTDAVAATGACLCAGADSAWL